jgi:long-chain acyl-CoA synthetase
VVTLYATLGDDAVIHGLNETECEYVLTSHELMPKFKNILQHTPTVKHLIYLEDPLQPTETKGFRSDVQVHAFCDVISRGVRSSIGKKKVVLANYYSSLEL